MRLVAGSEKPGDAQSNPCSVAVPATHRHLYDGPSDEARHDVHAIVLNNSTGSATTMAYMPCRVTPRHTCVMC